MLAKQSRNWIVDIFGLGLLFLGFYLLWLGSYPLFTPDEARYSEVAREMLATGNFITPTVNGIPFLDKPILYYWLQASAIALFGVKEWALRLFPVLSALVCCLMTYVCGRKLFDRKTGLIAATILATSPLYFGAAHYANLDLEVAAWISCSLLCIITGIQSESRTRRSFMLVAYIFAGLAVLTKGLIGIAFPVMITGAWIIWMWRWDIIKKASLGMGLLIIAAITLPWYYAVQQANPEFLHYFFVTQQYSRFLSQGTFNNQNIYWFYLPVIIAGFFPWALFLPFAIARSYKNSSDLYLLLWVIIVFTFFSIPQSKLVGYILPIFPALALITARYLTQTWELRRSQQAYTTSIGLILFCIAAGIVCATLPHYLNSTLIQHAKPLLKILANIVIVSAMILLIGMRYMNMRRLFIFCALLNATLLLSVVANARLINFDSTKNLVTILATIAKPQDDIVNYYKFHQDVPIYLGRKIQLVANWDAPDIDKRDNWVREMWAAKSTPGAEKYLISEDQFWKNWNTKNRVFIFVNDNYLEQFKQRRSHYYIIAEDNDVYLISNQSQ